MSDEKKSPPGDEPTEDHTPETPDAAADSSPDETKADSEVPDGTPSGDEPAGEPAEKPAEKPAEPTAEGAEEKPAKPQLSDKEKAAKIAAAKAKAAAAKAAEAVAAVPVETVQHLARREGVWLTEERLQRLRIGDAVVVGRSVRHRLASPGKMVSTSTPSLAAVRAMSASVSALSGMPSRA